MTQPRVPLPSIDEDKSLCQHMQHEIRISSATEVDSPCPDLLYGSRKDYITFGIPLYEASIKGDWKTAKEILDKRPELVRYSITENGDTTLHVAASAKSTKQMEDFVENLMGYMEKTDLELKNDNSNTALCVAAKAGNVKMVMMMMEKNKALAVINGTKGVPPLYIAAQLGHHDVVMYLYENSKKLRDDCWTHENRGWLFQQCVESELFDIALKIMKEHPNLGRSRAVLGVLAKKTHIFAETESTIITRTINWVFRRKIEAFKKKIKAEALKLLTTIWENIAEKPINEIDDILSGPPDPLINQHDDKPTSDKENRTLQLLTLMYDNMVKIQKTKEHAAAMTLEDPYKQFHNVERTYSSRILFVAVERGKTRFVVEFIRLYPDIVWKLNDDNQSIFHIAVRHRQVGINNLLHELGSNKDRLTPLRDKNDDTMLHLVARSVERKKLEDVSGGAFQMQRELLWFKEVEEMIPWSYRERMNKDGLTARELFTKEHQDLVVKGEEWMKGTASQCMVVAALIATIVFAAAFTVPGGYSQDEGIPFFYQNTSFVIFVVADAISVFSSSASILTFLSILTSGYAENDFLHSLPRKLMLGVATLYLSITTMMIAFSVSFFVLYSKHLKWIPILVTLIATMPVLMFAALQYRLLRDVIHSTYGSRYLFRPKKHVLYYESSMSNNPWFPFTFHNFILRCT